MKLKASDITVKGLGEDETAVFDKTIYTIKIESYESKLGSLTGVLFEPYIDVTELGEDREGEVLIHLVNPSGVTVTNTLKAKIKIES